MSPALAGRFFTTDPLAKTPFILKLRDFMLHLIVDLYLPREMDII